MFFYLVTVEMTCETHIQLLVIRKIVYPSHLSHAITLQEHTIHKCSWKAKTFHWSSIPWITYPACRTLTKYLEILNAIQTAYQSDNVRKTFLEFIDGKSTTKYECVDNFSWIVFKWDDIWPLDDRRFTTTTTVFETWLITRFKIQWLERNKSVFKCSYLNFYFSDAAKTCQ